MLAIEAYVGSDAAETRAYLKRLEGRGVLGRVAALLFRIQKASKRAKKYGPTRFRGYSYGRKNECLQELCSLLLRDGERVGITFGWKIDADQPWHKWVLYVDLPQGQVSFHSADRFLGPDYPGDWDKLRASQERILQFCDSVTEAMPSETLLNVLPSQPVETEETPVQDLDLDGLTQGNLF